MVDNHHALRLKLGEVYVTLAIRIISCEKRLEFWMDRNERAMLRSHFCDMPESETDSTDHVFDRSKSEFDVARIDKGARAYQKILFSTILKSWTPFVYLEDKGIMYVPCYEDDDSIAECANVWRYPPYEKISIMGQLATTNDYVVLVSLLEQDLPDTFSLDGYQVMRVDDYKPFDYSNRIRR